MKPALGLLILMLAQFGHPAAVLAQAPPASQACRVVCGAGPTASQPGLHQCLVQCMAGQPISRERPAVVAPAWPSGLPPDGATTAAPAALAQGATSAPPNIASQRPGASLDGFGAVYLANPPMGYGLAVGQRDRISAHRVAESACRASGARCVLAADFVLPCATVVEGVRRSPAALFMTSDPRTYLVHSLTHGVAGNPADAERTALDACRQRERGALTCRVVAALCGPL